MNSRSKPSTKTKSTKTTTPLRLANYEIVVLAAYLAGAWYKHVDTEDVAIKANELAPGRFTWRKYKDQIDIDAVRRPLSEVTTEEKGALLTGSQRGGWLLTEFGCQFAEEKLTSSEGLDLSRTRLSRKEEVWPGRERIRMLAETAYQKFCAGDVDEITSPEAERFFRVNDYVVGDARKGKIALTKRAFANESGNLDEMTED
jgi:hypothetical protein